MNKEQEREELKLDGKKVISLEFNGMHCDMDWCEERCYSVYMEDGSEAHWVGEFEKGRWSDRIGIGHGHLLVQE